MRVRHAGRHSLLFLGATIMSDFSPTRGRGASSLRYGLVGLLCCGVMFPLGLHGKDWFAMAGALGLLAFPVGIGFTVAAVWGGVSLWSDRRRLGRPLAGGVLALGGAVAGVTGVTVGGVVLWQTIEAVQEAADRAQ
jgi:hypothetical protein